MRYIGFVICIIILAFAYVLFDSSSFERVKPSVTLYITNSSHEKVPLNSKYINPNNAVSFTSFDSSGLREYSFKILDSNSKVIGEKYGIFLKKDKNIDINLPKVANLKDGDKITYLLEVKDWSNAGFFGGNKTLVKKDFIVDTKSPVVKIIAMSPKISNGGSAIVAFSVKGKNVKSVSLSNGINTFKPFLYKQKDGKDIYITLMAWPSSNDFFEGKIIAIDDALNKTQVRLNINKSVGFMMRKSNIRLRESFLRKKINEIIKVTNVDAPSDFIDRFRYVNEVLRTQDAQKILDKATPTNYEVTTLEPFNAITPFKNPRIVGSFYDKRTYWFKGQNIGTAMHMGIDLVDTHRHTKLTLQNDGKVVINERLSVHGNTLMVNHELGLSTLYAHMSKVEKLGSNLSAGELLGLSGDTGLAFGDHVHLETLVQGLYVRPSEWMDEDWINTNINPVIKTVTKLYGNINEAK
ncbi:hypothetical protein BKH43_04455 [Helicobacter sp. 13S00401-1]|uniref:M23 family metallopeptidase n=1 Tax=Helicobacter sp. 13S00401-1 TaxID=1905758 RepID=UPI000BA5BCAC|nr:M23 family metallopeptidase [Helicobacter sp. 13S00401-1]PAF50350.1 hypothetical protein BKH43_04455 [Helicobacter sp. 13S00401-1]